MPMTKQQEIDRLRDFITALPADSYLKDYFEGAIPHFEQMIRADIIEPNYKAVNDARKELLDTRSELLGIQKNVHTEQEKLKALEARTEQVKRALRGFQEAASEIQENASDLVSLIKKYGG